jgi:chromosome partitioning protein
MRTIAVVNQKGGCGKTITSINLSAFLALAGRRVLLVDMDPQAHSTLGLSPGQVAPARTMYDVFRGATGGPEILLTDVIRPVGDNFDLAPSDIRLSAIPEALAGTPGRERILAQALAGLHDWYDYILVDSPPNVGLLTFNAIVACWEAVIPMDPSFFSLHGIGKLFETLGVLEDTTGHRITPRVLVTLYGGRSPFVKAVLEEVRQHLAGQHFETVIRSSVKLAEAASHGLPITQYATRSAGYEDYQALANEVLREEAPTAPISEPVTVQEPIEEIFSPEEVFSPSAPIEDTLFASAPMETLDGVRFTIEAPDAVTVQLAGDFNDWTPEGSEMELAGQVWTKTLTLPPGRYRYRYVIDGRWQTDPLNPSVEPSPFGGDDSLIEIHEPLTLEWVFPQIDGNDSA